MSRASLRGITRFELLVTTSALGLLTALVLGLTRGEAASNEIAAAEATARQLSNAVNDWKRDHGELGCPTVSQLIVDKAWKREQRADDPWGGRFRILCSAQEVQVRSAGVDGEFETDDDVAIGAPWNS